ncbi:MAG: ABC transporter permease [Deltaproteobacteria bacterium]|nr:ABC transporter permease [Deltaproteobacteria bacterium]MBW2122747.1 ABC transporter permease [Deltaproteobacteria bacterium]
MRQREGWLKYILAYPVGMLLVFFVIPLAMLVVLSFYHHPPGGFYEPAFTLENYIRFFTRTLYLKRLAFTLEVSILTALICLVLGYTFTYYLTRVTRKRRFYIIMVISTLWLSYIIRSYAWTVLLSRNAGISQLFVWIGLAEKPRSYTPGFLAVLIGLVYVFLPFMILTLYGSLKSINPEYEEASLNLGAGPWKTFWKVTLPLSRNGIISGVLLVFVLTMGAYVVPSILGKPQQWTMAIIIGDQATYESNVPFGAAMALVLMVLSIVIIWLVARIAGTESLSMGAKGK